MLNNWNIKSRSHLYQAKGTPFQEGDFFTRFFFLVRRNMNVWILAKQLGKNGKKILPRPVN